MINESQPEKTLSFAGSLAVTGILTIVLGQLYLRFTPPNYQAATTISLHRWTTALDPGNEAEEKLAANECAVITSPDILRPVVQKLGLREAWAKRQPTGAAFSGDTAANFLRQHLDVHARPKSLSLEIRAVSSDPAEPASIANEVASTYLNYRSNQVVELNSTRVSAYTRQNEAQIQKINEAKARVDELFFEISRERATNQSQYYDPAAYSRLLGAHADLESELTAQQRQLDQFKQMQPDELIQVLSTTETNDLLTGLLVQASRAKSSLVATSQDRGPDAPEVKRVQTLLDHLNDQIKDQVRAMVIGKETKLTEIKSAFEHLNEKIKFASTNSHESIEHYAKFQAATNQLNQLQQGQADLTQVLSDSMRGKADTLILNYLPTVIQPADAPTKPFIPDPRIGGVSMLCGVGALILAATLGMRPKKKPFIPKPGKRPETSR